MRPICAKRKAWLWLICGLLAQISWQPLSALAQTSSPPPDVGTESVLASLPANNPYPGALIQFTDGNLYGIADTATVFSVTTGGVLSFLADVPPENGTGLVGGKNGSIYGLSENENNENLIFYSFTPATSTLSQITTLGNFQVTQSNQGATFCPLILGSDGNFYGTAEVGNVPGTGNGAIFKLTPSGSLSELYAFSATNSSFENSDGATPTTPLIEGTDGNFYGTTAGGGLNGTGTVFKITPGGNLTTLYTFSAAQNHINTDGSDPEGLVQGSDGNLYGATFFGGANGVGTLYLLTPDGAFAKLHDFGGTPTPAVTITANPASISVGQSATLSWSFTGYQDFRDGGYPTDPLIAGTDGSLYGVVGGDAIKGGGQYNGGLVFQVTPDGVYNTLYSFGSGSNPNDGIYPTSLILGSDGNLYGDTVEGGTAQSGTVFKLSVAPSTAPPPCTAGGSWSGAQSAGGTAVETPAAAGTYTYTLSCMSVGNVTVTQSATVQVTAATTPAPTVTIAANPTSIILGSSSTLTWSSTNASSCTASGAWTGSEASSGTLSVTPSATGTSSYVLTCTGSGGSASNTASVSVTAPPPPPAPTVSIAVSPASITVGNSATLTWTSTNATTCTASGAWSGPESTSGNTAEAPAAVGSYSYTLSCTGSGGSASASAALTVNGVPTQPPPPVNNGITGSAGGSFGPGVLAILGGLAALRRRKRLPLATLLCGTVLSAAVLPAPAQAQQLAFDTQHAYVGLKAGEGIYGLSSGTFSAELAAKGDAVSNISLDQHRVAGGIYGGIPFWAGLSVEAGLVDLGKYEVSLDSTSSLSKVTGDVTHALRPAGQGLTLGLGGAVPLTNGFSLEPHVAMLIYDSTQQANSAVGTLKAHKTGIGGAFGLSAFYRLAGGLNAGLGFDAYVQGGGTSVYLPSAQLEYRFGP